MFKFAAAAARERFRRHRTRQGGFGLALFVLALLCATLLVPRRGPASDEFHAAGVGAVEVFDAAYASWLESYAGYAEGGDVLVLGLSGVKGLVKVPTTAAGAIRLDLASGALDAKVNGVPEDGAYRVWLVDNLVRDAHDDVAPSSAHDDVRLAAELQVAGGAAHATTTLDVEALTGFDVDMVVVARADADASNGLLFGLPSLFQRMYHEPRGTPFGPVADRRDAKLESRHALATLLPPAAPPAAASLIGDGEFLFFEETFGGNGRTCGTCHPANNNFTLDPEFIATLDDDDPLFVAERVPALAGLENPSLLRELALVLENVDGFDRPGVMRGVPHLFALSLSMTPPPGAFDGTTVPPLQRTGWGGDGSPGGGTLREFAIGAVTQHAPKSLNRVSGVDFRLPTEYELDALEAFQLSLGRQEEIDLSALTMKNAIAEHGRKLFLQEVTTGGQSAAKCTSCHNNGGANASPALLAANGVPAGHFNLTLDIGSSDLKGALAEFVAPGNVPVDGGFGQAPNLGAGGFGTHKFNVPSLLEAPDTAPYFHDNSALTLENAVTFYLGPEFNGSPASGMMRALDNPPGFALIPVDNPQMQSVTAFLRVANAALNARSAKSLLQRLKTSAVQFDETTRKRVFESALSELDDAKFVLQCAHIHPDAIHKLDEAIDVLRSSSNGTNLQKVDQAMRIANGIPRLLVQ